MNMLIPKNNRFVSKKLQRFAEGQDCTLILPCCNHDPETTVLCHVRIGGDTGMAQKPHDFWAFHGCSNCHAHESEANGFEILQALRTTQYRVFAEFGIMTPR